MVRNGKHERVGGDGAMITRLAITTAAPKLNSCACCANRTGVYRGCNKAFYHEIGYTPGIFQLSDWTCDNFVQQGAVQEKSQ